MKKLGIIGCGWLGRKLAAQVVDRFHLYVTARSQSSVASLETLGCHATPVSFSEETEEDLDMWSIVSQLDVLVVSVPFSIKRASADAYKYKMKNLFRFIGSFKGQLFFTSSTGVYPQAIERYAEMDLSPTENTWERQIKEQYPQVNILRLAGLMGEDRLLKNYNVRSLDAPVNHVHPMDVCNAIMKMIEAGTQEALYNVVAPMHPSKQQVIDAQLGKEVSDLPVSEGRIIESFKIVDELGFTFRYPDPARFHL